jgi:hypothetical protein
MRLPDLDIDLLRAFVAVADSGSFTGAADAVGRSQSAVSQKIRRLEEIVEFPVFERTSRWLALASEGAQLLIGARRISVTRICGEFTRRLHSGVFEREMAGTHVLGGQECGSVPFPDNPAAIKDREPIGNGGADRQILLDEQYGEARGLQLPQNLKQAIDDDGSETFCRLVKKQKFRAGDESPPDREHLLLATGQLATRGSAPVGERREHRPYPLGRPGRTASCCQGEVFLDGKRSEDAAMFGDER